MLLVRQGNIEPYRFCSCIRRSSVGGFHDARSSTGDDDVIALSIDLTGCRHKAAEFAGDVIVVRHGQPAFGHRNLLPPEGILRGGLQFGDRGLEGMASKGRFDQPRTAEDHDRRTDALLSLNQFRLQEFKAKSERAQFIALEKVDVAIGRDIRRGCGVSILAR